MKSDKLVDKRHFVTKQSHSSHEPRVDTHELLSELSSGGRLPTSESSSWSPEESWFDLTNLSGLDPKL